MADRIGILAEGRLVQIGTPREIYTAPANLHVAARLGQPAINLLPRGLLPDADLPAFYRLADGHVRLLLDVALTHLGHAPAPRAVRTDEPSSAAAEIREALA